MGETTTTDLSPALLVSGFLRAHAAAKPPQQAMMMIMGTMIRSTRAPMAMPTMAPSARLAVPAMSAEGDGDGDGQLSCELQLLVLQN